MKFLGLPCVSIFILTGYDLNILIDPVWFHLLDWSYVSEALWFKWFDQNLWSTNQLNILWFTYFDLSFKMSDCSCLLESFWIYQFEFFIWPLVLIWTFWLTLCDSTLFSCSCVIQSLWFYLVHPLSILSDSYFIFNQGGLHYFLLTLCHLTFWMLPLYSNFYSINAFEIFDSCIF